jgi:rubrerythrin
MLPSPTRLIQRRFLNRLVASRDGLAFLLSFMVDAEEADEAGVFDRLLARVDDPELARLVRKHRDDEARHAEMLRGSLERLGLPFVRIPEETRVVPMLDRALGGFAESFVRGDAGIMEAYTLLQVIEERGVRQFPLLAGAIRAVDRDTADVIDRITADEARHVKYAIAIARRYAPDAAAHAATLARFREAEEKTFLEHGSVLARIVVERDLLAVSKLERLAWRALVALDAAPRPPSVSAVTS